MQYEKYSGLNGLFPVNLGGVKTHRDHFVIDVNKHSLLQRIRIFTDQTLDDEFVRASLSLKDTGNWRLSTARKSLQNLRVQEWIQAILYRPFDRQFIFFHDAVVDRSRRDVVRHMLFENVSLIAMRQVVLDESYTHFYVSDCMVDNRAFTSTKGIIQQFPLYLYPDTEKPDLFTSQQPGQRVPNLAPKLVEALKSAFKKDPTPEQIFHYIYGLLYSNAYRKKYAEFLKTDFPRVPFTKDYKLFNKLAGKGEELVELHLLKSRKLVKPIAKCEGSGDLRVIKVTYDQEKERVHINPEKWFANIPPEVWEYHIGGYQVSEKWLKDRKGKGLSSEEVAHYTRVVTAIAETITIQQSLDDLFAQVEASLLEVKL
jgi:predicted helicase